MNSIDRFPIIIDLFLFCLAIFLIIKGHSLTVKTDNNKIEGLWLTISKCKVCGQSNYKIFKSSYSSGTKGNRNNTGTERSSVDYSMICNNCGNVMFYESLSSCHEYDGSDYEENIPPIEISGEPGRSMIKGLLKDKLNSVGDKGCERSICLVSGYGLLLIFVIVFIVSWSLR